MRHTLILAIAAICAVADEASGAAANAGAGARASGSRRTARSSRTGRSTAADRDLTATTASAKQGKRQDEAAYSDDGSWSDDADASAAVVVGAVWKGGRQLQGEESGRWDDDEDQGEEEEEDDDDEEDDDADGDWGDEGGDAAEGDGSDSGEESEDWSEEETEEEEEDTPDVGAYGRGRSTGSRNDGSRRAAAPASGRSRSSTANASYGGGTRSSSRSKAKNSRVDRRAIYDDFDDYDGGAGRSWAGKGKGPSLSGTKRSKTKGGNTTGGGSSGVMKNVGKATGKSMKAMVSALQPKSVGLGEILDTWKIEQIVGKPPGRVTKCAATVEFRRDGTVATSFDGRESVSDFTFRAHAWPRACTIEFEAKAFQGPWDEEPVWKVYKGFFSRKLLDTKMITLEGTIYDTAGKMMWKRKVKSGVFTARRRPSRLAGGRAGSGKPGARRRTGVDVEWAEDELGGDWEEARPMKASDSGGKKRKKSSSGARGRKTSGKKSASSRARESEL
ncbi:unnamed protein product [Scytosiphon promiscuus]